MIFIFQRCTACTAWVIHIMLVKNVRISVFGVIVRDKLRIIVQLEDQVVTNFYSLADIFT